MPYSFTKIEEDKSRTIRLVFFSLIFFYFISFWFIAALIKSYFGYHALSERDVFRFSALNLPQTLIAFGCAVAIGYAHWQHTILNLINKILGVLKAEKLNPNDTYHQMLQNIIDEVSVATGGQKMEAAVIPTMAMNAFAIADFSGRAVIGVTEGILARLTRAQIEAVVGHEAAHIVTGDCLATTVTTSLFELYSGLLKGFELVLSGGGRSSSSLRVRGGGGGGGTVAFIFLVYILLYATRLLSQLVRLFISRQREFRADAIAVRLTRDPLSLAEALYAIKYYWRGS
jgi:Zn-dependent protease with chaperone function